MAESMQLAFDFEEFAREDARAALHEWSGAPLRFTSDYFPPGMLDEAFAHWQFVFGRQGSIPRSHMWHRAIHGTVEYAAHRSEVFSADLRPEPGAAGPGDLLYKSVCEPCGWQSDAGTEGDAVIAWHDHAVPGWRDLPVVPRQVRVRSESGLTDIARRWIEQTYPEHTQTPGAPIVTERESYATRHVPGFSPWGGYDLSATALDRPAATPPARTVRRDLRQFPTSGRASVAPRGRALGD
ncbi:DUF6349 family protein [Brevibacterium casei]|uniref:DUF6349 family protein n=1 Tax=Brevibacterium casei TaxID=33889 RepID=UPI003F7D6478